MLKSLGVRGHDACNLLWRQRQEKVRAAGWKSSQGPRGICCPDSQSQRDSLWGQSPQWQAGGISSLWGRGRLAGTVVVSRMPPFRPCKHCANGGKKEVFVPSPGLPPGGVFLQHIFKGFLPAQVQDGGTLPPVADQEGCRNDSTEDPTSAT